jgi:hypothetical protein
VRIKNSHLAAYLTWSILFILFSCGQAGEEKKEETACEIEKEYVNGPLTLVLKIDKKEISIAERITFVLEATISKEYHVEFPSFGENLEQFSIIDFQNPGPKLIDEEHVRMSRTYVLEPFLSGEYTIPSMTVKFWTDEEDPADPHILETEEQVITVTSILEGEEELAIKDIMPPVNPPPPDMSWPFFLLGGIVCAAGGTAGFMYWLKKRKGGEKPVITIPAHEFAYRELRSLVARNLTGQGEYRLFYFGISNILRHYLENRFHLHAPEQTTEEFLHTSKKSDILTSEQKKLLEEFLHHCDLVKFATHIPTNHQIQKTFDSCKEFITTTEDMNARIEENESVTVVTEAKADTGQPVTPDGATASIRNEEGGV